MGRTRLARARIEELKNRIVFCERNRRKLIDYLQDLKDKWLAKEIIYSEYEEIAGEKLEGRTRKEWINYYYNYIEDCEKRIRKEREKLVRNKIILVSFFAVFILIVGVFYVNPVIIGLIVQEQKQEFIQELNLEFTQSESYEWRLENIGELTSVRISGSIEKDGKVKVYLGDLLILDSNDNKIKKIITGQIVAVEEGKGILNFFKNILGVLGIIGRVVEELDEGAVEEPEESSSEESEGAPPEDSSPSQEEPSPSETEEEEPKEEIIEETLEEEQKVEGEQQIDGEEPVEVEEESKELIIEEEIIEESPEELKEKEKPKPKKEVIIREFTYICDETCDLSGLNLDKDSYTLRIEITGKTKLNLDKIKYEIIPFPVPEEEIEEEIPEEVPEEVPEEEKPKEEIIPEINVTELPTPEENITEIPENVTLIPQINITNITQAPVLIKNIPEIEIQKNTYGIIDVTEYFSDAEQFFILQVKNLTTTTYDHRIKIVPDKEFLGNRTVKIIASNSFGMAESNFFNIIVVEFLAGPRLLKDIPDIYILKNNFTEIDITQYFAGAEQYYLLQTINISTTTYDHTIKIQPDANFIGTRTSKIIAVNEFGETESNFFDIIVSEEIPEVIPEEIPINITVPGEVNISTLQYKAVINRPQKWIKVIEAGSVEDIANLTIELPKQAENITVKTGLEVDEALLELEEYEDLIEQANKEDLVSGSITGNVAFDVTQGRGIITRLGKWLRGFTTRRPLSYSCRSLDDQECKSRGILGITGNVISEEDLQEEITETLDSKIIDIGKIANETQENLIAVEYYTAGPIATEETTKRGKRVIVSAADELNYTDILAFTELTEEVAAKQIRLYRTTDGIREQTEFASYDLNNNGLIEYIEWIVPHLSNQTYELEIVIIDAEHLDENRDFVANIFEYVNTTDGITYTIPENQYARAYFERNLTNQNIIDVFVINTQPATIEVYEKDSDVVIGIIEDVTQGIYFITLNHPGSQSVFDLKSIGNEVIYDYIHDQQEAEFYEDWEAGNFNNWDNNNWVIDSAVAIETNSAKCETTSSTGLNCYVNTTASIDTSGSTSVNVSFQFNDDDTDGTGGGDVEWYWNDSDGVWDSFGLIDAGTLGFSDDVWNNYSRLSTDPQYQHIGFAVRFRAELEKNENYWIDNINVTSTPDETAPEVNITLPKNATYSDSHMPLNFNVSLNEQGSVQYSLDGGKNNITMFDGANRVGFVFNFTNTSIPDGSYTFQVYANDTYNNKNHTENVTFSIDKTIPDVNFTDPTPADGSSQTNTDIFVNISSSDTSDHYTFVDFDKDVFLWMTMEQSDGSVTDFSSYSNDGTFIGDAFQNTSGGRFGFGAQFDGVDEDPPDAINVSSLASSLRFNESFTVSVWIKTGTIVRADILGTRNTLTTGSGWKIGINQQDKPLFTANDTLDLEIVTSPEAIIAGEWVHIVGVYNKSTPSLQIYVNGTLKDTQTAGASTIGYANDQDFRIGMTDTNGRIWSGSIDEVMLFNRSLDAGEISALYNASATQYVHNFTGLSTITHNFTGYAVDIYGNKNQTEERNVTISAAGADSTPPDVNITFPENLTYGSNDLPLNFNVTLNENGSVQYTLD
ncbi:MAG: LamG domain-containing protein, partial [Nanoarchaeota archaeon]|nr:LamG domain-containing protein [Nanoarchaeota archaeon]